MNQTSWKKVYTDEFKREAVRLANKRVNVTETARASSITDKLLVWLEAAFEAGSVECKSWIAV